jgi:hypothetical protein
MYLLETVLAIALLLLIIPQNLRAIDRPLREEIKRLRILESGSRRRIYFGSLGGESCSFCR